MKGYADQPRPQIPSISNGEGSDHRSEVHVFYEHLSAFVWSKKVNRNTFEVSHLHNLAPSDARTKFVVVHLFVSASYWGNQKINCGPEEIISCQKARPSDDLTPHIELV